jgi:hypothetical protein
VIELPHNDYTKHGAAPLIRWMAMGILALSAANYIVHVGGFTLLTPERIPVFTQFSYVSDAHRMASSPRYAGYGPAFAEYMVLIVFQFFFLQIVFVVDIAKKISSCIFGRRCQSAEILTLIPFIIMFLGASFPWAYAPYGQESIFWNDNAKMGGKPIWYLAFLYTIMWGFLTVGAFLILFVPALLNEGMRRYWQVRFGKR